MFDIIKDIWKNPGAAYSPMPMWFWNDALDKDKLISQLDGFHRKGIDAVLICPRMGMSGAEYLSDEYFDIVEAVLEAAKKRFMLVSFCDDAMYPSGSAHGDIVKEDARLASRMLYALPVGEPVPENDDIQFTVYVKLDGGIMDDARLDSADGYDGYNLILGYTGGTMRGLKPDEDDIFSTAPKSADILNPMATDAFIRLTHEKYYAKVGAYFGQTVIGFFTDEPRPTGRAGRNDGISWTYGMIEDFLETGGEFTHLAALFFDTKKKSVKKDAEHIYREALRKRLDGAYYAPLKDWCEKHGVGLLGHPMHSTDIGHLAYFTIPGQDIVWRSVSEGCELTAKDSVAVKAAADMARHKGQSRSLCEVFGACGEPSNPWHFTPDEMMWYLNFCFARGCSMIVPHAFYYSDRTKLQTDERPPDVGPFNIWWQDYRKIAGYIKRMSWLGSVGTNNPTAAVLCSDEYIPLEPVAPLYENGYTFNYLSIDDFMERAHIHDGTVRIDRYTYSTVLVDGRLRLDAEIVKKLGQFAVEGGDLFRGADFIGHITKKVRRTSYFDGQTGGKLRFIHYSKSGCPFFVMINEGNDEIDGSLVTDIPGKAYLFDPFDGKISELTGEMCDGGFRYRLTVGAHEAKVVGMDKDALPLLGDIPEKEWELKEICSLRGGRMTFDFTPEVGKHAVLSFREINEIADIRVNGEDAGRLIFKPYKLDITNHLHIGENTVEVLLTGSIANKYGSPVPTDFTGCEVWVYTKSNADGSRSGENDEIWDIYDENRKPTGKTHRRGDAMPDGARHLVIHVWVRNHNGEYLLTKRSPDKMFPLTWECTGGSALSGEDSLTAALREVREETGLKLDPENGKVVINTVRDDYFGDIWLFAEDYDTDLVRLQEGETVGVRKATKEEIRALIETGEFAPYDYLDELLKIE